MLPRPVVDHAVDESRRGDREPVPAADLGPEARLCISWEGADRPEFGPGRPGGRVRRLLVGAMLALTTGGIMTIGALSAGPDVRRHVAGESVGSIGADVLVVDTRP